MPFYSLLSIYQNGLFQHSKRYFSCFFLRLNKGLLKTIEMKLFLRLQNTVIKSSWTLWCWHRNRETDQWNRERRRKRKPIGSINI